MLKTLPNNNYFYSSNLYSLINLNKIIYDFKYIKLIYFILKSKKVWKLPKKNKIIILDKTGSEKIIKHVLGHDNCNIMEIRYESINIPILLMSLKNIIKYKKYSYKITFIKYL